MGQNAEGRANFPGGSHMEAGSGSTGLRVSIDNVGTGIAADFRVRTPGERHSAGTMTPGDRHERRLSDSTE